MKLNVDGSIEGTVEEIKAYQSPNSNRKVPRERPIRCDVVSDDGVPARRGRKLGPEAIAAQEAVCNVLSDVAKTRSQIISELSTEHKDYVERNWQNVIKRLMEHGKAKNAPGELLGCNASYQKAP